jgi:dihydrofolate reductase
MRQIVLQMLTTLNGRVDAPSAWSAGLPPDAAAALDQLSAAFDTILVGAATYAEMAAYWPAVRAQSGGDPAQQRLAERLHACRKVVFSTRPAPDLPPWHNVATVHAPDDAALVRAVTALQAQPGADLHLAGGARLAQSFVRLGLVNRYHLLVHPVVSAGLTWFDPAAKPIWLKLLGTAQYERGLVGQFYASAN